MRRIVMMAMMAALLTALSAGAALAESDPAIRGTNFGDALYGTWHADLIYGYGGADLIYGYSGRDVLYGGNENGWGDKILGGRWGDKIRGQGGDDALYGQRGRDNINGGRGGDLVVGGPDRDVLNGGPGYDQINAQDGQRDIIIMCRNERDTVYYDWGIDVLRYCGGASSDAATSSGAASTAEATNLSTQKPPKGLFENSGKVLVNHGGDKQCVPEKQLKSHLRHDDVLINPSGCSASEQGR